jgi:hypothetical protein
MAIRQDKEIVDANAIQSITSEREEKHFSILDANGEEWVTPAEAARILHISVDRIYHIKNHLTHRKGNSPSSRVFFLKRTLFEDYMSI